MALIDLWQQDRAQLAEKHIQQIMTFAGDGKLLDDSRASSELRVFLRNVPSDFLGTYVDQCLQDTFQNSGLALQDLVNEIGRRLDFDVTPGRYRGKSGHSGHDGTWFDKNHHAIVIEVKTTDTYRIDLDTISGYRQALVKAGIINIESSSMLIVVGRQDTGDLEAQIRGSRHAWDMRLISVDALLRMLKLKEEVEDPSILSRIHEILIPREFTRLDPIIEIAFAAVEDVKQEPEVVDEGEEDQIEGKKFTPVAFHEECIARIEKRINVSLIKKSRALFVSPDEDVRILCSVSRLHKRAGRYWFAFHPHQDHFLKEAKQSYVAFGCGDATTLFMIPFIDFKPWLEYFNQTERADRHYWHIQIKKTSKLFVMIGRSGTKNIDITKYQI
jgi:hypothetical protein